MFLSDLSIKRPVFAAVMMLTLVTLGIFSYRRLAIDMFPDIDFPAISIVTIYPGASPESIEREVTKRIEEAVNPIAGVDRVLSTSKESVSTVFVVFDLDTEINDASQDARAKISAIRGDLPQDAEDPIIQKFDVGGAAVISIALRSDTVSPRDLTTIADKKIKLRIENISGVGKVQLVGESRREININVDPDRMNSLAMGVDEVIAGIRSENINAPIGRLNQSGNEVTARIAGKPVLAEQFESVAIAQREGHPVTLGDIAEVVDGVEEPRSLAFVDDVPAVALEVLKQSGANTVQVADDIKKEVLRLQSELPLGVKLDIIRDGSVFIRDSVEDVQVTLIIGGFLTVLIVFIFLNSWRSTVITGLTLPISVISSFIVMNVMGMTLNVMTLMALSLAIGLLIDDAIVVRENIVRHLERGKDHFSAARDGTSEIGLAVLATSLSIVAVFVPVAFMKGIVGRFFFHFGITIAFAVMVSLFVSFTLDPMLSSRWFDPDIERTGRRRFINRMLDRFNDWFSQISDRYTGLIQNALNFRKTVVFLAAAAFFAGIYMFGHLPSAFMTEFDQGEFAISFKTAPGSSLEETENRFRAILEKIKEFKEIDNTYSTIGGGDSGTVREGGIYVKLVEKSERDCTQKELQALIRASLSSVPGITFSIGEAGGPGGGQKPLELHIRGEDIKLLKQYATELKDALAEVPGIVDLESSLDQESPEFKLSVNRQKAVNSGIMTGMIASALSALLGGQAVTTYEDETGEAIDVRVRLPQELRQDISQIENIRFAVTHKDDPVDLIPLSELVSYELSSMPTEIKREALSRQVVVSANLDGVALGPAVSEAMSKASRLKMAPGYRIVTSGEAEDMAETFQYIAEALLLAVIMVYLILAAQFESFIYPLSIMLSLPLSIVGMAGMLLLTKDTVNIMSQIGLIMLMGLVTKNAILLVDYANVLRSRGMARFEAVVAAGRTRLRPILMTTLAMIFGMLPLALEIGAGAEMRSPMARAVIGGLITSTLLTLLVVPVVYTILDDAGIWLMKKWNKGTEKRS